MREFETAAPWEVDRDASGCAVVASGPASAFELFGVKLWGSDEPETRRRHRRAAELFRRIHRHRAGRGPCRDAARRVQLYKDREKPASGVAGLLAKARGDYKRLLATLYGEGPLWRHDQHPGRRHGSGRPAAGCRRCPIRRPSTVSVDTGPLFHFRRGRHRQSGAARNRLARRGAAAARMKAIALGEVARSGVVLRAEKLSVEAWRQQGHAKARSPSAASRPRTTRTSSMRRITVEPGDEGLLRRRCR